MVNKVSGHYYYYCYYYYYYYNYYYYYHDHYYYYSGHLPYRAALVRAVPRRHGGCGSRSAYVILIWH